MTPKTVSKIVAATLLASAGSAYADTRLLNDHVVISGFGTAGWVRTNTDDALFGRDRQGYGGADKSGSFEVDSRLGLQATVSANRYLSGTVQGLTVKRQTEDKLTTQVEWAYVKVAPINGLAIRGGRMPVPVFMVSDSMNVGYANNWLRAPNEVYGLVSFRRLEGYDVSYQRPVGPTNASVTLFGGKSTAPSSFGKFGIKDIFGGNFTLETDWVNLRYGQIRAKYDTAAEQSYKFESVGASIDRNNVVLQAEAVRRVTPEVPPANSKGWSAMGAYRSGKILPYLTYGSTEPKFNNAAALASPQDTVSVGARWEAYRSIAIKGQIDRIATRNTKGTSFVGFNKSGSNNAIGLLSPVTTVSVAVDFVF
jgi:hypothetical protein